MSKTKSIYVCTQCGGSSPRWLGQCPHCKAWNTLEESVAEPSAGAAKNRFQSLAKAQPVATLSEIEAAEVARTPTGLEELDRVLGGGIVEGGVVLIGGDPGIG
ncbi:MAG: DNA repair protein RadA, partial [Burkholderiaceae bacterium]